jgi:putative transposase
MTRKLKFEKDQYYHIYNRGTDKRDVFMDKGDLYYFFDSLVISNKTSRIGDSYNSKNARKGEKKSAVQESNLVSIVTYCLLPNHFHLILKEETDGGISKFMQKVGNSYTKYFNKKHERSGSLFQGRFKSSLLAFEDSLNKTSNYVNLNYKHHFIDPKNSLVKTSLFEFLGTELGEKICDKNEVDMIVKNSGGIDKFKSYLKKDSKIFTEEHNKDSKKLTFLELEE